jgi:hypothetical protein
MRNKTRKIVVPLFIGLIATNFTCNGTFWSRVKGLWRNPYQQQADEYTVTPWKYGELQREIQEQETDLAALKELKQKPVIDWEGQSWSQRGHISDQGDITVHNRGYSKDKIRLLHLKKSEPTGEYIRGHQANKILGTEKKWYTTVVGKDSLGGMKKIFWRPATEFDIGANRWLYNDLKRIEIPRSRERYREMSIPYYIQQGWGY